jgi:hypothetical protein
VVVSGSGTAIVDADGGSGRYTTRCTIKGIVDSDTDLGLYTFVFGAYWYIKRPASFTCTLRLVWADVALTPNIPCACAPFSSFSGLGFPEVSAWRPWAAGTSAFPNSSVTAGYFTTYDASPPGGGGGAGGAGGGGGAGTCSQCKHFRVAIHRGEIAA